MCLLAGGAPAGAHHGHHLAAGARKAKLRRFNSHDTSSNMFSVAEFENARLARRNEIENQRLARRLRNFANSSCYGGLGSGAGASAGGTGGGGGYSGFKGGLNGSGDYSTGDSKASKGSSEVSFRGNPKKDIIIITIPLQSQQEALPADVFLERHSLPRVVRILLASKSSNETLQSSSSHGSSTAASSSSSTGTKPAGTTTSSGNTDTGTGTHSSSSGGSASGTGTGTGPGFAPGHKMHSTRHSSSSNGGGTPPGHDELFLLYRQVRQRNIYHGHNAKSQASQRKKSVLIPQEFPGEIW